ncbi:hypothetical protein [Streptomyces humi]|nr:hypothetical protein [Streptomyces humi]
MAWNVRADHEVRQVRAVLEGLLVGALLTGAVLVGVALAGVFVLGGADAV